MKKILGLAIVGVFALNIGTALAGLDSTAMDGGWWVRGVNDKQVVSQYVHYTKKGQASTLSGQGNWVRGPWRAKNVVSKGNQKKTGGSNKAYYNHT